MTIVGLPFILSCLTFPLLERSQVTKLLVSGFVIRALPTCNMKQAAAKRPLRLLLNGGDNMLGRAVQLSFPIQAKNEENIMDSCPASHYLDMCLHQSGKPGKDLSIDEIRHLNKHGKYLWGDYLNLKISPPPDMRMLNMETAITRSIQNRDVPAWKGIRYHMHVDNLEPVMRAFVEETHGGNNSSPLIVSYANNHCMDYGRSAFEAETLPALETASPLFQTVGCGRNLAEAQTPAIVDCGEKGSIEVFAFSTGCSGTPHDWWATMDQSGLVGLPAVIDKRSADRAFSLVQTYMQAHRDTTPVGRMRILSIHWGPNWAMKHEDETELAARREFAHRLIDECDVDLIYGHSSHHARGMELYHDKLVLYGTGDLINDYEGFENCGEERYNKLGGLYVVDMDAESGNFLQLRIVPMYMNRLRLERFTKSSQIWSPNTRRMESVPSKSEDLCRFINGLSRLDAGSDGTPLLLEHVDAATSEIPGGPLLKTKLYQPAGTV